MPRRAAPHSHTIVVVGGAGTVGQITVRDLFETAPHLPIVIADCHGTAAQNLARSYDSSRVRGVQLDVTDIEATTQLLRGAFAVICTVQHQHNLAVMEAACRARVHYCDLGGLFHTTRKQLAWNRRFQQIDRLALLGMGAAPGITNLLAAHAIEDLDRVESIAIRVAGVDCTVVAPSIQTILAEASCPAAIFTRGRFAFVPPLSQSEAEVFPKPVGLQHPAVTLHSEVATLPLTYRRKGVQEVDFRMAFDPITADRLRFLHALKLTSTAAVPVDGARVVPMSVLLELLKGVPKPQPLGPPQQVEYLRAVVHGRKGRERVAYL